MSLSEVVRTSLERSMTLYEELVIELDEAALVAKLPGIPSNTVGSQLWCVVGARESFARAIRLGAWSGFSCSLTSAEVRSKDAARGALAQSADELRAVLADLESVDDDRGRFVVGLVEHEAAHQGQLIRYLYGLSLPIPVGWKAKYALD